MVLDRSLKDILSRMGSVHLQFLYRSSFSAFLEVDAVRAHKLPKMCVRCSVDRKGNLTKKAEHTS